MELARLFGVTVSELMEPENLPQARKAEEKRRRRRNFEIIAVGAYTGFAVLSTIQTDDPGFYVYASVLIMIAAMVMAFNISRLPAEIRRNMALKELAYCVTVWCLVTFLPDRIGNVYTSVLAMILCVLYAVYIRFPEHKEKGEAQ